MAKLMPVDILLVMMMYYETPDVYSNAIYNESKRLFKAIVREGPILNVYNYPEESFAYQISMMPWNPVQDAKNLQEEENSIDELLLTETWSINKFFPATNEESSLEIFQKELYEQYDESNFHKIN